MTLYLTYGHMRSFMKKIITLILTLIVALSLGCALTACKDKPAESVGSGKESVGETDKESVGETDKESVGETGGESDAAAAMSEEVFATLTITPWTNTTRNSASLPFSAAKTSP